MKNIFIISSITAAMLLGTTSLYAKENISLTKKAIQKEVNVQQKSFKIASENIMKGFHKTLEAIDAIEKKDNKKAQEALKQATQYFDKALKANPKLKLVPIDNAIEIYTLNVKPEQIEQATKQAISLLKKHEVQSAEAILQTLKDEMDIETIFIPMDLYPTATKKALETLKKNDAKKALAILIEGLNTFIKAKAVIPVGLLAAQDLVEKASKLEKSKKDEAIKLLEEAKTELQKSYLLGYVKKHSEEYASLNKQIEKIEKEIKEKNETGKLYKKLKNSFKSLLQKVRQEYYKNTVAQKEAQALKNPASVKGHNAAKAKIEEMELKDQFEAKQKMNLFEQEANKDKEKTIH